MLRRVVALACLALPLACKSSDNPPPEPPNVSDAGEPGHEPSGGGADTSGGGKSSGGKSSGGTSSEVGGEPAVSLGGAPTEPGSWDEANWDEAVWQ